MKTQATWLRSSVCLVALLAALPAAAQTQGRVTRSSVDSGGLEGNGSSGGSPAISADGRFVAFESDASNLVPGDTNLDTDVFVHDHLTGVTERVSVAWNGNEARDDSHCPAISADGRYVAFQSQAWNLYKGGANLGHPRLDVYVRDRQAGTTTRVSVAQDGSDPDFNSDCPSISGDGRLVAFASGASNLVADDQNGFRDVFVVDWQAHATLRASTPAEGGGANGESVTPRISGDGHTVTFASYATNLLPGPAAPQPPWGFEQVFVRNLDTGELEQLGRPVGLPFGQPDAPSFAPSISADGRYVAFVSFADDLVSPFPNVAGRRNVFIADRVNQTTILASPFGTGIGGCSPDRSSYCKPGDSFEPAISADGRFVTFASVSHRLLPENLVDPTQVFLFDQHGKRMRRLSVDHTGVPAGYCAEPPQISGDGRVVAYRTYASTLVPEDHNNTFDVFRQEWNCRDDGRCQPVATCRAQPQSCAPVQTSTVRLRKHAPGGTDEDRFVWRWTAPLSAPLFPDPGNDGMYQICVYAGASRVLSLDVATPAAKACSGAGQPCWLPRPSGFKLRDAAGGLPSLTLRSSSRKRQIDARGRGSLLGAPDLPLDGSQGITVQLQAPNGGPCWTAEFAATSIKKNFAGSITPDQRTNGWLAMQIP